MEGKGGEAGGNGGKQGNGEQTSGLPFQHHCAGHAQLAVFLRSMSTTIVQVMSDFAVYNFFRNVKIAFVTATQPGCSKPWVTDRLFCDAEGAQGTSKNAVGIGIDVGQIGVRSGNYCPVNTVWAAMGPAAHLICSSHFLTLHTFNCIAVHTTFRRTSTMHSTDICPLSPQYSTTSRASSTIHSNPSASSPPNIAPSPNTKSKAPGSRTHPCPNTLLSHDPHLNCFHCFNVVARSCSG